MLVAPVLVQLVVFILVVLVTESLHTQVEKFVSVCLNSITFLI
jgi:hypothetical protein